MGKVCIPAELAHSSEEQLDTWRQKDNMNRPVRYEKPLPCNLRGPMQASARDEDKRRTEVLKNRAFVDGDVDVVLQGLDSKPR